MTTYKQKRLKQLSVQQHDFHLHSHCYCCRWGCLRCDEFRDIAHRLRDRSAHSSRDNRHIAESPFSQSTMNEVRINDDTRVYLRLVERSLYRERS